MKEIREKLFELSEESYGDFVAKITPNIPRKKFLGIRTPILKKFAKELNKSEDVDEFLAELPHEYFDENQLHAFIISLEKDFDEAMRKTEAFLPYIDNWATCDQLSPKVFAKHLKEVEEAAYRWMDDEKPYTIRFGIGMLMRYFLDDEFDEKYLERVSKIRSEEYYVNMMIAWYFATALAQQYDKTIPFIEGKKLDEWTHNKAIQKAVESYRVSDEQKTYLKTLKIKAKK